MRATLALLFWFYGPLSAMGFFFPEKKESVFSLKSKKQIIKEYFSVHRKFHKQLCGKGEDQQYYKLLKEYRGEGLYIPQVDEQVDIKTISDHLPLFKEKLKWAKSVETRLKKEPFPSEQDHLKLLRKLIDNLLGIKKDLQTKELEDKKKSALKKKSKNLMSQLFKAFTVMMDDFYFLKSFAFPVDHFRNRRDYDATKKLAGEVHKRKSNQIYFYRKIVEDGAMDPNHTQYDFFARSSFDTIFLNLQRAHQSSDQYLLSEELRTDLDYGMGKIEKFANWGKARHVKRFQKWQKRIQHAITFYTGLINQERKNRQKKKKSSVITAKNKATEELKNFVWSLQAKSYAFWSQKSELLRAIWVTETILFNEVGRVDGPKALDRKDVAQIVINRAQVPYFQNLDKNEGLYQHLTSKKRTPSIELDPEVIAKRRWLNLLFKKAEFSFTFYYIASVRNIFCPDLSRSGRALRRKNVALTLEKFEKPEPGFKALRYFSRASMTGRIDMSQIWNDYQLLPERKGAKIKSWRLRKKFAAPKNRQYLYQFEDSSGQNLHVYRHIPSDTIFVANPDAPRTGYFTYRNPHYFKFFEKKQAPHPMETAKSPASKRE